MILESSNFGNDSVAEWSKASDSSSDGAIRVGSNPTAVIFAICRAAAVRNPSYVAVHALLSAFGDTVAEWLRRRPAKPMCSARVGSNPIGVVVLVLLNCFRALK